MRRDDIIRVRQAKPTDALKIGEVDIESFMRSPYGEKTELDKNQEKLQKRLDNAGKFCEEHPEWVFVALDDNDIVGFATLEHFPQENKGRIQNNAVLPEYRNRGIGTLLVSRCIEELRNLGVRSIIVHTAFVPSACRVYEKAGFRLQKREGERSFYCMDL